MKTLRSTTPAKGSRRSGGWKNGRLLAEIDSGYDFKVIVVDDAWVVRLPRREGVVPALEAEITLLPVLAARLPVEVPQFELVSAEPPFVVYRLLRGSPLVDEDGEGVRAFLDALHGIDPAGLAIPRLDWVQSYVEQCAEFEQLVLPELSPGEQRRARRLFAEVETLTGFEPRVLHADLGPEHLLVRDGRLAAVIDWGDARVGDPALDYAWLLNGPFPDWDVDVELRRRALVYHRLGPWYEAHYGLFTRQPRFVQSGLSGIRARL
jgi:aminoglycoside phosphotransferase (APT) family kinase protein